MCCFPCQPSQKHGFPCPCVCFDDEEPEAIRILIKKIVNEKRVVKPAPNIKRLTDWFPRLADATIEPDRVTSRKSRAMALTYSRSRESAFSDDSVRPVDSEVNRSEIASEPIVVAFLSPRNVVPIVVSNAETASSSVPLIAVICRGDQYRSAILSTLGVIKKERGRPTFSASKLMK